MSHRYAGVGLAFLAASTFFVGSAGAVDPGQPLLDASLKKSGPYGADVFVKSKHAKDAYVRVTSTHTSTQNAVLTEASVGATDDYKFKWFRGNEDISHDVQTSGYGFGLPAAAKRKFRVQIKPRVNNPGTACLYSNVSVDTPPFTPDTSGAFIALHKANGCEP
jgi:hypothetical protein